MTEPCYAALTSGVKSLCSGLGEWLLELLALCLSSTVACELRTRQSGDNNSSSSSTSNSLIGPMLGSIP